MHVCTHGSEGVATPCVWARCVCFDRLTGRLRALNGRTLECEARVHVTYTAHMCAQLKASGSACGLRQWIVMRF
jgi:hypothetical protein